MSSFSLFLSFSVKYSQQPVNNNHHHHHRCFSLSIQYWVVLTHLFCCLHHPVIHTSVIYILINTRVTTACVKTVDGWTVVPAVDTHWVAEHQTSTGSWCRVWSTECFRLEPRHASSTPPPPPVSVSTRRHCHQHGGWKPPITNVFPAFNCRLLNAACRWPSAAITQCSARTGRIGLDEHKKERARKGWRVVTSPWCTRSRTCYVGGGC